MAESTPSTSVVQVSLPEQGEVVEYQLSADTPLQFNFFVTEVLFSCDGNDLILTGETGGVIVLHDYQTLAQEQALPTFILHSGEEVPGEIYLFAFSDAQNDVETAAGAVDGSDVQGQDVIPNDWLEPLLNSDKQDAEPTSFLHLSPHHDSVPLEFDQLFSSEQHVGSLAGAAPVLVDHQYACGMLSEVYDPVHDTIQHILDSPDLC